MFTDRLPLTLTPKTISLLLVICNRGLLGAAHNSTDFEVSLAFNGIFGTVIVIAILLAIITILSLYVRKKKLERAQQLNQSQSSNGPHPQGNTSIYEELPNVAITKSSKPASVDLNLPPPPVTARPVRREGKTRLMTEGEATYKYPFTTAGSSSQEASNLQPVLESTDDVSQTRGKVKNAGRTDLGHYRRAQSQSFSMKSRGVVHTVHMPTNLQTRTFLSTSSSQPALKGDEKSSQVSFDREKDTRNDGNPSCQDAFKMDGYAVPIDCIRSSTFTKNSYEKMRLTRSLRGTPIRSHGNLQRNLPVSTENNAATTEMTKTDLEEHFHRGEEGSPSCKGEDHDIKKRKGSTQESRYHFIKEDLESGTFCENTIVKET